MARRPCKNKYPWVSLIKYGSASGLGMQNKTKAVCCLQENQHLAKQKTIIDFKKQACYHSNNTTHQFTDSAQCQAQRDWAVVVMCRTV